MKEDLIKLLDQVRSTPDFCTVDFKGINDTNVFGDNALHCICVCGDIEAAKLLVENGININQHGEGDLTPLNVALDFNHNELADYLIQSGADTSVIGAEFKFDVKKHDLHIQTLESEIHELETTIKHECDDDA